MLDETGLAIQRRTGKQYLHVSNVFKWIFSYQTENEWKST